MTPPLNPADTAAAAPTHPGAAGQIPAASAIKRTDAAPIADRLMVACGLSLGAGLIHIVAAVDHLEEYTLYALFFAVLALAQFAWGIALYQSQTRKLMMIGAVTSMLVVTLWLASRTTGLPIGPTPWSPEPVGAIDTIASADEFLLALLVTFELRAPADSPLAIAFRRIVTGAGLWFIMLSSLALIATKHAH